MVEIGIQGLPDLVNALIMTSVLPAGNGVVFAAARTLYGMAIDGKAPRFFARCTHFGLPYYSVIAALAFCLLALLQLSESSSIILDWLVGICTALYLLNYFGTVVTYLHFYASLRRQGVNRDTLLYKGILQPYAAWYACFGTLTMALVLGYTVFIDGHWGVTAFFTSYTIVGFFPAAFLFWKIVRRTRYVWPGTADLQLGNVKSDIDLDEAVY